jgi:hypothetical protein
MKTDTRRHLSVNHFLGLIVFLNLVLVILSIASYASVMNSIVYWTKGYAAIDYRFLTNIVIGNEQTLFSSLDIPSYFLLATVAVDLFAIAAGSVWKFQEDYTPTRRFGVLNAFIAFVAIVSYGGIMTILTREAPAGRFQYQFPSQIMTTASYDLNLFDPTPWILIALLVSTLIMALRQTIGLRIRISVGKHRDD